MHAGDARGANAAAAIAAAAGPRSFAARYAGIDAAPSAFAEQMRTSTQVCSGKSCSSWLHAQRTLLWGDD